MGATGSRRTIRKCASSSTACMGSQPPSRTRGRLVRLTALFSLAAAVACAAHGTDAAKDGKAMSKQDRRWEVWDQQTLILELTDTAGAVSGPSGQTTPSPLLTARIVSAPHEAKLRQLL